MSILLFLALFAAASLQQTRVFTAYGGTPWKRLVPLTPTYTSFVEPNFTFAVTQSKTTIYFNRANNSKPINAIGAQLTLPIPVFANKSYNTCTSRLIIVSYQYGFVQNSTADVRNEDGFGIEAFPIIGDDTASLNQPDGAAASYGGGCLPSARTNGKEDFPYATARVMAYKAPLLCTSVDEFQCHLIPRSDYMSRSETNQTVTYTLLVDGATKTMLPSTYSIYVGNVQRFYLHDMDVSYASPVTAARWLGIGPPPMVFFASKYADAILYSFTIEVFDNCKNNTVATSTSSTTIATTTKVGISTSTTSVTLQPTTLSSQSSTSTTITTTAKTTLQTSLMSLLDTTQSTNTHSSTTGPSTTESTISTLLSTATSTQTTYDETTAVADVSNTTVFQNTEAIVTDQSLLLADNDKYFIGFAVVLVYCLFVMIAIACRKSIRRSKITQRVYLTPIGKLLCMCCSTKIEEDISMQAIRSKDYTAHSVADDLFRNASSLPPAPEHHAMYESREVVQLVSLENSPPRARLHEKKERPQQQIHSNNNTGRTHEYAVIPAVSQTLTSTNSDATNYSRPPAPDDIGSAVVLPKEIIYDRVFLPDETSQVKRPQSYQRSQHNRDNVGTITESVAMSIADDSESHVKTKGRVKK